MTKGNNPKQEQLLLAEMQVLLAELRTHLSLLRTGAALFVGTMTIAFLVLANMMHLPEMMQNYIAFVQTALVLSAAFGIFLFIRSERKIVAIHRLIKEAEHMNGRIDRLMV